MPWNPENYSQFKDVRDQPFYDLMDFIQPVTNMKAVDLGCGTGEQTAILAAEFSEGSFLGIDSSVEMLEKAGELSRVNLRFLKAAIETFAESTDRWDLIFSNAALQWADGHEVLFPKLIALLESKGQFAVQMPVQDSNILNQLLLELANQEPYKSYLGGWTRKSPVLSMDDYARMMFEGGLLDLQVIQKVYPIIADDRQMLYDFIAGSALIPYMERLNAEQAVHFAMAYQQRIEAAFPKLPAIYAFKRLLIYGRKS